MPRFVGRLRASRPSGRTVRAVRPRAALAAAADFGRHAHLLAPSSRRVAYVGWAGHDNMGDEAVFAAYRAAFPLCDFAGVSHRTPIGALDRVAPGPVFRAAMLGGGTLVGWPGYRRTLERLFERAEALPALMLGTGVEDPSFAGENPVLAAELRAAAVDGSLSLEELAWRELARWRAVLARFGRVAVRGPRSAELLRRVGIESEAVGDSALLLADDRPAERFREKLLGVNVGWTRGLWGGDPGIVLRTVAEHARALRDRGWRIRLVPVWPGDMRSIEDVAASVGTGVEIVERFLDLDAVYDAIRECHVFVGQKLHSVVFASGVYVPSVMLEYHPKCADFHDSLGRSRYTIRTDRVTVDGLTAAVEELAESRDAHQAALVAAVGRLRGRLADAAEKAGRALTEAGVPDSRVKQPWRPRRRPDRGRTGSASVRRPGPT